MSAWGGPPVSGAWANQVDEEEELNEGELPPVPGVDKAFPTLGDQSYPSLADGLAVKSSKRDRRAKAPPQKMNLGSFLAAGKEQNVDLPTAPRERAEGDDGRSKLGGGFQGYGGDRGGFGRDRDEEREDPGPSRADADGDWGSKKIVQGPPPSRGFGGGGFGDRGSGFGSDRYSERRTGFTEGNIDRADTADKWGNKSYEPSTSRSGGGFDSGRRESRYGGFRDDYGSSRAETGDRWARRPSTDLPQTASSSGGRPRLNLAPRSADLPPPLPPASTSSRASEASNDDQQQQQRELSVPIQRSTSRSNPFGDAKPVAVKEATESRSRSSATPSEAGSSDTKDLPPPSPKEEKPRARVNPFGDARPREEILKELEQKQPKEEQKSGTAESLASDKAELTAEAENTAKTEQAQTPNGEATKASASDSPKEATESRQPISFLEKAKAGAQKAAETTAKATEVVTEKVTEAVSKLTVGDSPKQESSTNESTTPKSAAASSQNKPAEATSESEKQAPKASEPKIASEENAQTSVEPKAKSSNDSSAGATNKETQSSTQATQAPPAMSWAARLAQTNAAKAPESQIPA